MNQCIFLGRLVKDPIIRNTQNGGIVYSNSVAINRQFKREGEPEADFINIISFGKTAEFMQKYMKSKGQQILIETHLQNRSWIGDNGEKHYATDFIVDRCFFADSKKDGSTQDVTQSDSQPWIPTQGNSSFDVNSIPSIPSDDSLPF